MTDLRIKRLADILVNYSVNIKKGSIVEINSAPEAKPLVLYYSIALIPVEELRE